jgi:general stress protein 26
MGLVENPPWITSLSIAVNVGLFTYLLYRSEALNWLISSLSLSAEIADEKRRRSDSVSNYTNKDLVPPLPKVVRDLLSKARLCYLATSDEASPHLSLMNFTYTAHIGSNEGDCVIMSTRRDTKKYTLLTGNSNVAVLIHDFSDDSTNHKEEKTARTITLNGTVREESGEAEEAYRKIHLHRNPDSAQFIEGPNMAIITITVETARICDINDKVHNWSRNQEVSPSSI